VSDAIGSAPSTISPRSERPSPSVSVGHGSIVTSAVSGPPGPWHVRVHVLKLVATTVRFPEVAPPVSMPRSSVHDVAAVVSHTSDTG
jgi:hypothetical protein